MRKNPVYRGSNSRPNVSEGYEVTSELPGRPARVVLCPVVSAVVAEYSADFVLESKPFLHSKCVYPSIKLYF